jgi:hypothetical protein
VGAFGHRPIDGAPIKQQKPKTRGNANDDLQRAAFFPVARRDPWLFARRAIMRDLQFLVVIPADDFRCACSTDDGREAKALANELGGLVAILPGALPFAALVNFLDVHRDQADAGLRRLEWRAGRIEIDPHCEICRRPLTLKKSTVDHVIPISRGGTDRPDNWLLACRRCNEAKGDLTLCEYRDQLLSGALFDRCCPDGSLSARMCEPAMNEPFFERDKELSQ